MDLAWAASIANNDNPLRRLCPIELRRCFFMRISFENDLSVMATITGNVKNRISAVITSIKPEDTFAFLTISMYASCLTVLSFAISLYIDSLKRTIWSGNAADKSVSHSRCKCLAFSITINGYSFELE